MASRLETPDPIRVANRIRVADHRKARVGYAAAAAASLLPPLCANATVFKWQPASGSASGNINDAAHWDQSGGPPAGNSDTAIIDYNNMGTAYTVTVDNIFDAGTFTLNSVDAMLVDDAQHDIRIGGNSDLKVGTVQFGSQALWSGNGTSGLITVEGPVTFTIDSGNATIREDLTTSGTFKVGSTNLSGPVAGNLYFDDGTTTTNNGSFTVNSVSSLNIKGSKFVENAGTFGVDSGGIAAVTMGGSFQYTGGTVSATVSLNSSNLTLSAGGPGTFIFGFTGNTLDGTVSGQSLVIQGDDTDGLTSLTWNSGFTNAGGTITLTSIGASAHNSSLTIKTGNALSNSSEIDFVAGTGGNRYLYADAVSNTSTGTINVSTNTIVDNLSGTPTAFTNAGKVTITSGGTMTINSGGTYTQSAGDTQVDGTLALAFTSGVLHIDGGILQGTGTVSGNITTSGTARIDPGDSIGTLSVTGNVIFSGSSGMNVELGTGGAPGISDLLAVTGNIDLSSATSEIDLTGGSLTAGQYYTILTYTGTRTGTFADVTPGYTLDYSHAGAVRITAVPEPVTPMVLIGVSSWMLGRRLRPPWRPRATGLHVV